MQERRNRAAVEKNAQVQTRTVRKTRGERPRPEARNTSHQGCRREENQHAPDVHARFHRALPGRSSVAACLPVLPVPMLMRVYLCTRLCLYLCVSVRVCLCGPCLGSLQEACRLEQIQDSLCRRKEEQLETNNKVVLTLSVYHIHKHTHRQPPPQEGGAARDQQQNPPRKARQSASVCPQPACGCTNLCLWMCRCRRS